MTLTLPSTFDIGSVSELVVGFREAVESGDVVIDATRVTRVDATAIQLLCALAQASATHARRMSWQGRSQVIDDAARLLGVAEMLGA